MNKHGAAQREHVLFINADREYREGKAQNHLRPEDIDKIIYAYRAGKDIPSYTRRVPKAEIIAEDYMQSQSPEVLEALGQAQTRLAELQALFAAADDEDFENSDDTGVTNSDQVKSLKARLKEAKGIRSDSRRSAP